MRLALDSQRDIVAAAEGHATIIENTRDPRHQDFAELLRLFLDKSREYSERNDLDDNEEFVLRHDLNDGFMEAYIIEALARYPQTDRYFVEPHGRAYGINSWQLLAAIFGLKVEDVIFIPIDEKEYEKVIEVRRTNNDEEMAAIQEFLS